MKLFLRFLENNRIPLIGVVIGLVVGYVYWYYVGCYWGTYPLSSEWWVNCGFGGILGGFAGSLFKEKVLDDMHAASKQESMLP